jgi:hypothetical protein
MIKPKRQDAQDDRLVLAAQFIAVLHELSQRSPKSWRRIGVVGKRAGIGDSAQLEQAVRDAMAAGLVDRQVDSDLVIITNEGTRVAALPLPAKRRWKLLQESVGPI